MSWTGSKLDSDPSESTKVEIYGNRGKINRQPARYLKLISGMRKNFLPESEKWRTIRSESNPRLELDVSISSKVTKF